MKLDKYSGICIGGSKIPAYSLVLLFICGAAIMVLEIAGSRQLAIYFGNTIFLWAAQISVVLATLSLGYFKGGEMADREGAWEKFTRRLLVAGIWIAAAPIIVKIGILLSSPLGNIFGPIAASAIIFSPPIYALAMATPIVLKQACKDTAGIGKLSGFLYAYSTVASIAGTLGAGMVLVPVFGLGAIFAITGLAVIALALAGMRKKNFFALGFLPVILFLALAPGTGAIYSADSPYYHIEVIDAGNVRYLKLDSDFHSARYIGYEGQVFDYMEIAMQVPSFYKKGDKALAIGLGSGGAAKTFAKTYNYSVDVAEIDPALLPVAKKYFGFDDVGGKIKVHMQDARQYLGESDEKYGLIFADAYSGKNSIPFHLATREFFAKVRERLSERGLLVSNIISSPKSGIAPHFHATLRQEFKSMIFYCTREGDAVQNIILIAHPTEDISASFPKEIAGFGRCDVPYKGFRPFSDAWAPAEFIIATS